MAADSLVSLDDYRPVVGDATVDRIAAKAEALRGMRVAHMNSTYYAGGVVEILLSMTTMMNQLGIETEWRLLRGRDAFFEVTREMHEAIQGGEIDLTDEKKAVYKAGMAENAMRNYLDHDAVFMHDHHTMGMVEHYRKKGPWIWRCHLDLTNPNPELMDFLRPIAEQYDAMICILEQYKQDFDVPQFAIMPAIDPIKPKNAPMSEDEIRTKLVEYDLPTDRPIVTQISRFDRWKDPHGVIDAFALAHGDIDAQLVLLGNKPSDDPDVNPFFDSVVARDGELGGDVRIITNGDPMLVNALQHHATVALQKSIREGFGLTVAEALWKGTPVIGGNCGGIPEQIEDGYLVDSVEEAGRRIAELVNDPEAAAAMGSRGRETVREKFLLTRLMEEHFDLLASFEPSFTPTLDS